MSLLSSLCSNGLNVLLSGRHYLWQRFPQCQFVHRGKHSSKGTFFSGCQTQLHQQWRALRVWLQPFLGHCGMEQCLLSSITSPETLAPSLLPSQMECLFISSDSVPPWSSLTFPTFTGLRYLQNHVALIVSVIDLGVANFMGLVIFQLESKLLLCMETPLFRHLWGSWPRI